MEKNIEQIIKHYKMADYCDRVVFYSSEKVSKDIKIAMMQDSSFYSEICREFHSYPIIKTIIYFKSKNTDIFNFLELGSIRKIFLNDMKIK